MGNLESPTIAEKAIDRAAMRANTSGQRPEDASSAGSGVRMQIEAMIRF